jgi:hypothetical protein
VKQINKKLWQSIKQNKTLDDYLSNKTTGKLVKDEQKK